MKTNRIGPTIVITVLAFLLQAMLFGGENTLNYIIYWAIAVVTGMRFHNIK